MRAARRKLLERFRALPGDYEARVILLVAKLKAEGVETTWRKLIVDLRESRAEEISEKHARILATLADGHSVRETARLLNIPFTTVSYAKTEAARKAKKK